MTNNRILIVTQTDKRHSHKSAKDADLTRSRWSPPKHSLRKQRPFVTSLVKQQRLRFRWTDTSYDKLPWELMWLDKQTAWNPSLLHSLRHVHQNVPSRWQREFSHCLTNQTLKMKGNPNQTNGFLLMTADKEKVTIYGVKRINQPRLLYQSSPRVAKSKDLALQVFFTAHLILEKRKICTTLASNRPCRWRLRRLADMVSFLTFYWLFSGVSRSLNCSSLGARKV